jgi:hypothetical protein
MEQKDWETVEAGASRSQSAAVNLSIQLPNSLDDDEDSLIHIIPPVSYPKTDNGKPQEKEQTNEQPVNEPHSITTTSERTSPSSIPPSQLRQTISDPLAASSQLSTSSSQTKLIPPPNSKDVDMLLEELLLTIPPGPRMPLTGRKAAMICRVYVMNRWFKVTMGK